MENPQFTISEVFFCVCLRYTHICPRTFLLWIVHTYSVQSCFFHIYIYDFSLAAWEAIFSFNDQQIPEVKQQAEKNKNEFGGLKNVTKEMHLLK